jgi:Fur family peroxide stress response transcriptional regulator
VESEDAEESDPSQTIIFIVLRYTLGVTVASDSLFREMCASHGIGVTHQRQVLYEVMREMAGHPSPEEVYVRMRERMPSISLATVYKNIHLFVESGIFRKMSLHHGTVRVEMNEEAHHHLVCSKCKSIADVAERELALGPRQERLAGGFLVERYAVDVIGVCAACQAQTTANADFLRE